MSVERLVNLCDVLVRCVDRLEQTVEEPVVDLRDIAGVVKHFELAFEQAYRTIMELLLTLEAEDSKRSVKVAFRRAMEFGWIVDEAVWLGMIADRNTVAHTYDEPFAMELIDRIKTVYGPELRSLARTIAMEAGRLT